MGIKSQQKQKAEQCCTHQTREEMSKYTSYERASLLGHTEAGGSQPRPGLRWGAPQETSETKDLDNRGVHDLSSQKIQEQDKLLDILGESIERQKNIALHIGHEVDEQIDLIADLDHEVQSTQTRVSKATMAIRKIDEKSSAG